MFELDECNNFAIVESSILQKAQVPPADLVRQINTDGPDDRTTTPDRYVIERRPRNPPPSGINFSLTTALPR